MTQRIVVKIGSSSLTSDTGGLNPDKIRFFASELAQLQQDGIKSCSLPQAQLPQASPPLATVRGPRCCTRSRPQPLSAKRS